MNAETEKKFEEIYEICYEELEICKIAEELAPQSELVKRYNRTLSYIVRRLEVLSIIINGEETKECEDKVQ